MFVCPAPAGEFARLEASFYALLGIGICLTCNQVFTGRAASFSELHDSGMISSAVPSTISTVGGTTVTLLGTNLCRRDVSVAIDLSYSTILHVSSKSIVLRTPAGLNHRPFLNLSYSLMR